MIAALGAGLALLLGSVPRGSGRSVDRGAPAKAVLPIIDVAPASTVRRVSLLDMGLLSVGQMALTSPETPLSRRCHFSASASPDQPPRLRISVEERSLIGTLTKHHAGAS